MLTDQQIDALLDANESKTPNADLIDLQMRVNERRRQRNLAVAKGSYPEMNLESVVDAIHKPLSEDTNLVGIGMDELCLNVEESENNLNHLVFSLIEVYRKERSWQRHLSPLVKAQAASENS
jgi:hypothetical protein